MRHYPRNSPQAAARVLALTMIADGNVSGSEIDAVRQFGIEVGFGLPAGSLGDVLKALCEDLLQGAASTGSLTCCIDDAMVESLLRDVDDPDMQRRVVAAVCAAAEADGHLADGEMKVLGAIRRCWPLAAEVVLDPARLM